MRRSFLIKPIHPGTILLEEFLQPMGISQYRLAKDINVLARRINQIIKGTRAITVDTALRLALFFGMSSSFWLGLQKDYELDVAKN
jgi:addiction module HigA family antidote